VSTHRAERAYALLLRAYPAEFRAAYAREMMLVFRELVRQAGAPGGAFWMAIVADVARSAPTLRLEALGAQWNLARIGGRVMRPMGLLAMVIGLLEAANAVTELSSGGPAQRGTMSVVAVTLAVVGGALLVAAGVGLRHARTTWTRNAALGCLLLFVLARSLAPWMSIASAVIGNVFPILQLLFVWRNGRSSRPTVA
jgi:hypothetical protein